MHLSRLNQLLTEEAKAPLLSGLRVLLAMLDTRDYQAAPGLRPLVRMAGRLINSPDNATLLAMLRRSLNSVLQDITKGKIRTEPRSNVTRKRLSTSNTPWLHRHVHRQLMELNGMLDDTTA